VAGLSRREFLTLAGAGVLTSALAACAPRAGGVQDTPAPVTPSPLPDVLVTDGGFEMVRVMGGSFERGSMGGKQDEQFVHTVTITRPYYIATHAVTFDQYKDFCRDVDKLRPDVGSWGRGNHPVCGLNWYDAVEYCNWLSAKEGLTVCYDVDGLRQLWSPSALPGSQAIEAPCYHVAPKNGYRLPTEAEWEYAAKGGSSNEQFLYPGSDDPDEVAWYADNSDERPHSVGQKMPNELGLYDMSGNVREFCWDRYGWNFYLECRDPVTDPKGFGILEHPNIVLRGGDYTSLVDELRVEARGYNVPTDRGLYGIRLVRNGAKADDI